jgi:TatD DNase family protein
LTDNGFFAGHRLHKRMIDAHCHLHLPAFDADRSAVLARSRSLGVCGFISAGVTREDWSALLKLCQTEPDIAAAIGIHPLYVTLHEQPDLANLERILDQNVDVCAIGEIGLDYQSKTSDRSAQLRWLNDQVALARTAQKPVVIHVRKAHADLLQCLTKAKLCGGLIHAFNGSLYYAQAYIALGFALGIGGAVTFTAATRLRRMVQALPIEAIVLETDAPDMCPAGYWPGRNSPEFLPDILATVAELKGMTTQAVAQQTTANVQRILNVPTAQPDNYNMPCP